MELKDILGKINFKFTSAYLSETHFDVLSLAKTVSRIECA